jgi:glucokinase
LLRGEVATDPADPSETLRHLASEVRRRLTGEHGAVVAVGMACAGIVSPQSGSLGRSPNLPGWEGLDLGEAIRTAFSGVPAVVANDVNAALYGEWRLGAGLGCADLVMIALGTGVGGAIIVDGRLVTGTAHGAGEIGHMVLDMEGPPCTCGNRGCLEAYAGEVALVRRAREQATDTAPEHDPLRELVREEGRQLRTEALFRLARQGDRSTSDIFQEAGRRLGQAVANVVNILDPARVIIGGGVSQAGDLILDPCRQVVRRLVLSAGSRDIPIVPAALGPFAAALGAAIMAREGGCGT